METKKFAELSKSLRSSVRELAKLGGGSRLRPKRIECMKKIADTKAALSAHHTAAADRLNAEVAISKIRIAEETEMLKTVTILKLQKEKRKRRSRSHRLKYTTSHRHHAEDIPSVPASSLSTGSEQSASTSNAATTTAFLTVPEIITLCEKHNDLIRIPIMKTPVTNIPNEESLSLSSPSASSLSMNEVVFKSDCNLDEGDLVSSIEFKDELALTISRQVSELFMEFFQDA